MKRIVSKSNKGFTLLEVMLAVAIMVIASTMIMKGFIAVMIMAGNNARFAKSGEENYRRAMNQTVAHYATVDNQQTTYNELGNGNSFTLQAVQQGEFPVDKVALNDLSISVDVTAYTDDLAPVFSIAGGNAYTVAGDSEPLDASTVVNNRFAFFYDLKDDSRIILTSPHTDSCIIRFGYIRRAAAPSGSSWPSYLVVDKGEKDSSKSPTSRYYGYYCFNADHCTVNDDGSVTWWPCTYTPVSSAAPGSAQSYDREVS